MQTEHSACGDFFNPTIANLCKFEPNLNVMKSMFNFAAYRGFAMINFFFPVYSVVWNILEAFWSAYNTKINFTQMLIVHYLITLFNSDVTGITINHLIIFPEQLVCFLSFLWKRPIPLSLACFPSSCTKFAWKPSGFRRSFDTIWRKIRLCDRSTGLIQCFPKQKFQSFFLKKVFHL